MLVLLLVFMLQYSYTQVCQNKSDPTSISDCNTLSDSSNYCCFTEMIYNNTKNNMCNLFAKNITFILPYIKQMNISTTSPSIYINIDCGINNYQNNTCGISNPKDINDCNKYSNNTNACCLFQSSQSSVCFYNDMKSLYTEQMFGYTIQCNSYSLVVKYFYIFLILFILI
jgi:hypothetical protein